MSIKIPLPTVERIYEIFFFFLRNGKIYKVESNSLDPSFLDYASYLR